MRSRSSKNGLRVLAALAASAIGLAQTPPPSVDKPASVEGKVTNALTGAPLLRAHVTLRGSSAAQQSYGAMTDGEGKFSITALPAGSYTMTAQRVGFTMLSLSGKVNACLARSRTQTDSKQPL